MKCSTYLQDWCLNKMRSQVWKRLVGKTFMEISVIVYWTKESSVCSAQRSTSFQILYRVLVRYTRTPNRTMHGKTGWDGSKLLQNTETLTESTESQSNSSRIFSQDSTRCSSVKKSKVYCTDCEKHQKISQEEFYLCRRSTTFPVEQQTMNKDVRQTLDSYLCMQVLVPKRSGIL